MDDGEETTNHILIHCDGTKNVVESYFSNFCVECPNLVNSFS